MYVKGGCQKKLFYSRISNICFCGKTAHGSTFLRIGPMRLELYNMVNWSWQGTDFFRKILIFFRAHTIYDCYDFIGHTTLTITHTMTYLGWHSNLDEIALYLTSDFSLKMRNGNKLLLLKRAQVFQSF